MSGWGVLVEHEEWPVGLPNRLVLTLVATSGPYYCLTCRELIHGADMAHSGHSIKGVMLEHDDAKQMLDLIDGVLASGPSSPEDA